MAGSVEMTAGTGIAPEACSSSPGNANLRIGTQAGSDEDSHSNLYRKYALRHISSISPTHDAVIPPSPVTAALRRHSCARRRYVHPPASFLRTPPLRPPSGVIPAHAAVTSTLRRHSCAGRNLNASRFL